jgi:hypothetical protein
MDAQPPSTLPHFHKSPETRATSMFSGWNVTFQKA